MAFPLSSLTLPLASRRVPLILSFVLDFMNIIRCAQSVRTDFSANQKFVLGASRTGGWRIAEIL
jgi:hypothetical protein